MSSFAPGGRLTYRYSTNAASTDIHGSIALAYAPTPPSVEGPFDPHEPCSIRRLLSDEGDWECSQMDRRIVQRMNVVAGGFVHRMRRAWGNTEE